MSTLTLSPLEIARQIFPDVPHDAGGDGYLGYVIWNYTGYPEFWRGDPETCFRQQLQAYHDDPAAVEKAQQEAFDALDAAGGE